MSIFEPEKTFSSMENRTLKTMPKFSYKSVKKGRFQKKYETYLSDQFPARNTWIKVQTKTELLLGKRDSNNVYFGKDNYLLEKYTENDFDKKQVKKNIKALSKFVEQSQKTTQVKVMIVPSKTHVMHNYLPAFAESYDEEIFYDKLENALPKNVLIPITETLSEHNNEEIYYRTDHHWTTLGAWYGYESYINACEKNVKNENISKKENLQTVTENFLGTTYSKVNIYTKKDKIQIYTPECEMKVIYNLGEKTENGFYQMDYLKKKDKYSIFFGGNQAVLEISGGIKNGRTLLIFKDSFANCLIPFLTEDYEKVIVIDLRQLNVGKTAIMQQFKPTDVLVLYNTIQFFQDIEFAIKK